MTSVARGCRAIKTGFWLMVVVVVVVDKLNLNVGVGFGDRDNVKDKGARAMTLMAIINVSWW